MKMEIKKLSKKELISLKEEIDNELMGLATKEKAKKIKSSKNTLLGLKSGDKIFGIRLSSGPHRLKEPKELNCEVDIVDYCRVEGNDIRKDDFRINISLEGKSFGIGTTLSKERHGNKHYLLSLGTFNSGYDAFYTLKPKTWKKDLVKAYEEKLVYQREYYEKELGKYTAKMKVILDNEDKINGYI